MTRKIAFAIHDAARDGRAFEIDPHAAQALVFGEQAPVRVSGTGVLAKHLVVLPHEGELLAASASDEAPAFLGKKPIGKAWVALPVPCRVKVGRAVIDFFVSDQGERPPPPSLPQIDAMECTAVKPLELRATKRPPPSESTGETNAAPEMATASPRTEQESTTKKYKGDESLAVRAAIRLRDDYKRLSTPKRLLVPIAAALLILVSLPGTSHGTSLDTARYVPAAAAMANDLNASASASASASAPASASASASAPASAAAPALASAPAPRTGVLPSGRSLPSTPKTTLTRAEKTIYHKAIDATLTGDFDTANRLYELLLLAHPDSDEIKAAHKVIGLKLRSAGR